LPIKKNKMELIKLACPVKSWLLLFNWGLPCEIDVVTVKRI
jgi:hypothetical protein